MFNSLIMIAEDSHTNLDILYDALKDTFEIAVAMDGNSALNVIEDIIPDLILLDIEMPGIDGYEVCRIIKSKEKTKNIPVIFITAHSSFNYEAKGLELGAADFITKPFNVDLVKARIKNHILTKKLLDEKEKLIKELKEAISNVKTLKSLLPICSHCKKIRDDQGYWSQVEIYISKNSGSQFSHGICPDCLREFYPDIAEEVLNASEEKLAKDLKIQNKA